MCDSQTVLVHPKYLLGCAVLGDGSVLPVADTAGLLQHIFCSNLTNRKENL